MNDNKTDKFRASYQFFLQMQTENKLFSMEDISSATGWSKSTVRTYAGKKWTDILVHHPDKKYSTNISSYSEEAYVRMMSQSYNQSKEPFKPKLPQNVEELVIKAKDSALLSVDIYNRPVATFRSQGYIVMMIIAWTALFHAIFELENVDYFYKENDGSDKMIDGEKKAWELDTCIDKCDDMITQSAKDNLKLFILLRNKIEHRYVPAFDLDIFGECQSLLLNFEELLTSNFGDYYSLNDSLTFPLQTTSARDNMQIATMKKIQSEHYNELKQYIDAYRDSLSDEVNEDSRFRFRVYLVPQIGNHRSSSDCAVEFLRYDPNNPSEFESIKKDIALIKEKRVPVANQGMLRPKKICDILSSRLGQKITLNLHTKAWRYYDVRKKGNQADGCKTEYCQFDEAHGDYIYTPAWIDYLFERFSKPEELERVRNYR